MKTPFRKFGKPFFLGFLSLLCACLMAFQNCSNVRLIKQESVELASGVGSFCSLPPGQGAEVLKILFVVDMSGSNIIIGASPTKNGVPTGTDPGKGSRFDLIQSFLSSSCANTNTNNQFGVIGFSATTFGATCTKSDFGSLSATQSQLDNLTGLQAQANADIMNQQIMTQTYYLKGFECARNILRDDVANLTPTQKKNTGYLVYFLTDGVPTDFQLPSPPYVDIPREKATLEPVLNEIMLTANSAGGGRIAPILYGQTKLGGDLPLALDVLGFIALKGDGVMTTVDKVGEIDFCALLNTQSRTQYTVKKFGVANLNALMRQGHLLVDSDMDGIPDVDEERMGFDPTQSRTGVNGNQLLDGLCPKGSKAVDCPVQTDCGPANELGLTKCDVAAYGLTDGLDSDRDMIPDVVEILKGTQPNSDDRMNDVDGDLTTLVQEIANGRDPFFSDPSVDPTFLLSFTQQLSRTPVQGCASNQESWIYELTNIPIVSTLATSGKDPITSAIRHSQHEAGENVIFVYYIVGKLNDDITNPTPAKLFGQFVKVKVPNPKPDPAKFQFLGDIDGEFKL